MASSRNNVRNKNTHYIVFFVVLICGVVANFMPWNGALCGYLVCWLWFCLFIQKFLSNYCAVLDSVNKRVEIDELTGLFSRYQIQQELSQLILSCRAQDKS